MKQFILIFFCLFSFSQSEVHNLKIEIPNVKESGVIYIAIYDNAEDFNSGNDSPKLMIDNVIEKVRKGRYLKTIYLPSGDYAIKVLVDNNNNGEIDFNFFGLPVEQFGFSNNVIGLFGAPKFDIASFKLIKDKKIIIKLR
tara:strand:- start:274 stop:693 length:420 start_codon:yes stop_codon:yes gene_type:complete